MKKGLIIATVLIVALSLLVPLFLCDDFVDYSTKVATMLSGLCGLGTLFIAILLYDRYGVESKTKERTLAAIEETIAEIQKVNFILCYYSDVQTKSAPNDYIISLSFQGTKERALEFFTPESLSAPLYYKSSGMYGCSQVVNNTLSKVFLPKSIAEAVNKLYVFKYEPQTIAKDARPITTLSASSDKINNLNDSLDGADTNMPEEHYSVIQFLNAYYGVKDAILKWYKDNNIDTTGLNI